MGALEDIPLSIPRSTQFSELQRLLVSRNFVEFADRIRPILENRSGMNQEVFLLLLKDAFDLLGPDSTHQEQQAIDSLYDRYADSAALPDAAALDKPPVPASKSTTSAGNVVIHLKRVVQVNSYCHAGFEATDCFSMQRTVYRSPQERSFHRAVQSRYPGMLALPNYPLASVLNDELLRRMVSRRMFAYAMRCILDFLLVTPGEGDPVAAFELDSSFHENSDAQIRDKMKDSLLATAGIPLFRLRVDEPKTVTADDWYAILSDQIGELPVPPRYRSREQAMSFVPL